MIRLVKPYIELSDVQHEFEEIFSSGWFTQGKFNAEFQESLSQYLGCKYVHLTTSATTALSLALRILDIQAGDEVIISDFSFPATANVVEEMGAIPVFADVSLENFNMLPDDLERKITNKTRAVVFVDAFGNLTNIDAIKSLCDKYQLPLIEDAACAIGSGHRSIKCGNISDITCFSFHPRKLLTTGEGGAITTNNSKLSELLKIKLNHGARQKDGKLDFISYGYNYRMTEIQALMGLKQLINLDHIIKRRQVTLHQYVEALSFLGFEPQVIDNNVNYNVQSIVFKTPANCNRDELIKYLFQNNIESTIGTYCLSATTYYQQRYHSVQPNAYWLQNNTITLPCYDKVPVDVITKTVKMFLDTRR
ncbi:MAG: DegT/DnrJ/EryC1/StrS family aminotransferase [Hahellaceae bacterium]|nr:DegT/DnrJ/EryC1/StrS family aminotransferase [Hahellaceae bacterium]MCP5211727.1 DegT/DnrJ/EryC1/StrS family aminotransferase [Hahellaceae bacterium]